jgi:hypothetical protein
MSSFDSTTTSDCEIPFDILIDDHSESNALSESLPNSRKTCSQLAHPTWKHSWEPEGNEPKHGGKRNERIFYWKHCTRKPYSTWVSTIFQNHLMKAHSIQVGMETIHPVKKAHMSLLRYVFAKAGQSGVTKLNGDVEQILRNALNPKAILEALVQLVTVRNVPYNCS